MACLGSAGGSGYLGSKLANPPENIYGTARIIRTNFDVAKKTRQFLAGWPEPLGWRIQCLYL
jgi:hypothetical protein